MSMDNAWSLYLATSSNDRSASTTLEANVSALELLVN